MEMIAYVTYVLNKLDMNAGIQMISTHAIVCECEYMSVNALVFVSLLM